MFKKKKKTELFELVGEFSKGACIKTNKQSLASV